MYPPAPWRMTGDLWLSLFRLPTAVDARRPAGVYGAAFVSYAEPSPLTYSELLVGRMADAPPDGGRARAVTITDIWVDSPESRQGGRELWAIPKDLCDFTFESARTGPLSHTDWSASVGRHPIASATFHDISVIAPPLPFQGIAQQAGVDETGGEDRVTTLRGRARTLPCRGGWEFGPDGPLGWLGQARQLSSARMARFTMSFG